MRRNTGHSDLRRLALFAAVLAASASICGAQRPGAPGSLTLATGAPTPSEATLPLSLGSRSIGDGAHRNAMLSVADSVLQAWGWRVASVDPARGLLRSEWLYFAGTTFSPSAGLQCANGSVTGLRFEIAFVPSEAQTPKAVLHGEATIVSGRGRADGERFARRAFGTMGDVLREVGKTAAQRPDSLIVNLAPISGEVRFGSGARGRGCATVRP